ncbi:hypothetical protein [Pseudomonas nicosulfuronedens]
MTLADERRAIRSGISAARQSQQLVNDLQSLESRRRKGGTLNELERRGILPAKPGRASYTAPASTGGGIASPLTVQSVTYAEQPQWVETVDGSGLFRVKTISSIQMVDADGNPVVISGFGTAASTGGE